MQCAATTQPSADFQRHLRFLGGAENGAGDEASFTRVQLALNYIRRFY
jgi:hypothetical protein